MFCLSMFSHGPLMTDFKFEHSLNDFFVILLQIYLILSFVQIRRLLCHNCKTK